jgi:hypothetical protein
LLLPIRFDLWQIGGCHAQRDVAIRVPAITRGLQPSLASGMGGDLPLALQWIAVFRRRADAER